MNKMVQEGKLGSLCCIVLDELHMIGDDHRGYLLELLLRCAPQHSQNCPRHVPDRRWLCHSKLNFLRDRPEKPLPAAAAAAEAECAEAQVAPPAEPAKIQLIGMSATLPNLAEIAGWAEAALFTTDFRPVPLVQAYKLGQALHLPCGSLSRTLDKAPPDDPDHLALLTRETVDKGHQVGALGHSLTTYAALCWA